MHITLRAGLTLRCGARTLEIVRELADDEFQLEDCITRKPLILKRNDLLKRIWSQQYQVLLGAVVSTKAHAQQNQSGLVDLSTLDAKTFHDVERKLDYIHALAKGRATRGQRKRVQTVIEQVALRRQEAKPPSASTVMGWARIYQTNGNSAMALLSGNRARRRNKRLSDAMNALITRVLREVYFTRDRRTQSEARDRLDSEVKRMILRGELGPSERLPSQATLSRRINEVDQYRRIESREGSARARMECRTSMDGTRARHPYTCVEVDHTALNWVVICDRTGLPLGRPVLTVMIDAYSSYVLGFYLSFYGPGLTSVSGVIRNAVTPKDDFVRGIELKHRWLAHGLADELVLDNGMEFHSAAFKSMAWEMGSSLMFCRVRTPWLKPHVERFFSTLNFIGLVRGRVHKRVANSMNLNPDKDAAVTFSNLVKGLVMFVADVHPFEVNERKIARPYDLFMEGLESCPPTHYPGSWEQFKLTTALSTTLTVGPGGIELRGLPYGSSELLPMRERYGKTFKTLVKWDPDDMSVLYVRDPQSLTWITSPCRWSEHASGLSWNQHLLIRNFARKELKLKGAEECLRQARLRLSEHWLGATTRKGRADALQAARFSGVTSAHVLSGSDRSPAPLDSCRDRPAPTGPLIADAELARMAAAQAPDFDSFSMGRV